MKTVTVDTIFNSLGRNFKDNQVDEIDVIEWIGEALEHMKVPQIQEEAVSFLEVKDFECLLPQGFNMVLQIAASTNTVDLGQVAMYFKSDIVQSEEDLVYNDDGEIDLLLTPAYSLKYNTWVSSGTYNNYFEPVRLSNNTFFNSIVCKEKKVIPYANCRHEYTVVDDRLRFSFKEGIIALSYLKTKTDKTTGYPLIPDDISYITAVTYYIKWKTAENELFNNREGSVTKTEYAEQRWLKYCRQGKSKMKMPKSLDDFQDMLEESHQLIPNKNKYYGYFGRLGRTQYLNTQF